MPHPESPMTPSQAAEILTKFSQWRKGAAIPQPSRALTWQAIDMAIMALKAK